MKNYLNVKNLAGGALALLFAFSSCSDKIEEEISANNPQDVPAEIVAKFQNLGFNTQGIKMEGANYLLEGDMVITPAALAEMGEPISVMNEASEEQYRTYNLVSCPGGTSKRTILVRSYITSGVRSTGIDYAIANWNALNTCFTFQRVYSGSANIYIYSTSGAGGSAGFPSGGNPYPYVYMGSSLSNSQTSEHVATHEIGHCFGLRHSDWWNRAYSCGSGGNEGETSYGAVHIPGTPARPNYDPNSIMNSCYSSSTNGEFSSYDRIALEYLY